MTEYITVKDGIVTGHFASKSDTVPEDGIVVENFLAPIGFYYKEDYIEKDGYTLLKPYIELFKNGHMAIPEGYMLAIVTRSGLGLKKGVTMANSFGVIDADYRGDIGLIVQNNGFESFTIQQGDKIGQGIIYKCEQAEFTLVDELDETERGEGGYGHTGVRN